MKNFNDTIGNRTRDLTACSAMRQPTACPQTKHSRQPKRTSTLRISDSDKEEGARVTNRTSEHKLSQRSVQRRATWKDVPRRLLTYERCTKSTLGRTRCAVRRTWHVRHDLGTERDYIRRQIFVSYIYIYI